MSATTTESPAPALTARQIAIQSQRESILSHYTTEQTDAFLRLSTLVIRHPGTSSGNAAARLLLGLYNGQRFPFDLTDLRLFDPANLNAALIALRTDAAQTWCEVHVLLDAILGSNLTQARFEVWAYNMKLRGRCTKAGYEEEVKRLAQGGAA